MYFSGISRLAVSHFTPIAIHILILSHLRLTESLCFREPNYAVQYNSTSKKHDD